MQPLRTKGWDRALLEFTATMLTESASESKPPLAKRLNEISCPGNNICLCFLLYFGYKKKEKSLLQLAEFKYFKLLRVIVSPLQNGVKLYTRLLMD